MKLKKSDLLKTIDDKTFIDEFLSIIVGGDIDKDNSHEITFIENSKRFYIGEVEGFNKYNIYHVYIGNNIDFENISSIHIEASSDTKDNIMDFSKSMKCLELLKKYFLKQSEVEEKFNILLEACKEVVKGYTNDGFEQMNERDYVFYNECKKAIENASK